MRCPFCGDRRTEIIKTVYRGHNSYGRRRLHFLRLFLQHTRAAGALEPRRAEMAWRTPPSARLEKTPGRRPRSKMRGRVRRGFPTSWRAAPCGSHRTGQAHPAAGPGQSGPLRKPGMYLRKLPRL